MNSDETVGQDDQDSTPPPVPEQLHASSAPQLDSHHVHGIHGRTSVYPAELVGRPRRVKEAYQRPPRKSFVNCCLCYYHSDRHYKPACFIIATTFLIFGILRVITNSMALALKPLDRDSSTLYVIAVIDPFAAIGSAESLESYDGRKDSYVEQSIRFSSRSSEYLVLQLCSKLLLEIVPALLALTAALQEQYRLLTWFMLIVYVDLACNLVAAVLSTAFATFLSAMSITADMFGGFVYTFCCIVSWSFVGFHIISLHVSQGLRRQLRELTLLVAPKPSAFLTVYPSAIDTNSDPVEVDNRVENNENELKMY